MGTPGRRAEFSAIPGVFPGDSPCLHPLRGKWTKHDAAPDEGPPMPYNDGSRLRGPVKSRCVLGPEASVRRGAGALASNTPEGSRAC